MYDQPDFDEGKEHWMPEDIKTGVVYKIPCRDCEHVYMDESKRTLKKQIAKHKQAVRM